MHIPSGLVGLACFASTAMSAVIVRATDNTRFLQGSVDKAKHIIPSAESFLESTDDRKKALVLARDISGVSSNGKLQGLLMREGRFAASDCDKAVSLLSTLSEQIVEASSLLTSVGTTSSLDSMTGPRTSSLKRDMRSDIYSIRLTLDPKVNPDLYPLMNQLRTKCPDYSNDINSFGDKAVVSIDQVYLAF